MCERAIAALERLRTRTAQYREKTRLVALEAEEQDIRALAVGEVVAARKFESQLKNLIRELKRDTKPAKKARKA